MIITRSDIMELIFELTTEKGVHEKTITVPLGDEHGKLKKDDVVGYDFAIGGSEKLAIVRGYKDITKNGFDNCGRYIIYLTDLDFMGKPIPVI